MCEQNKIESLIEEVREFTELPYGWYEGDGVPVDPTTAEDVIDVLRKTDSYVEFISMVDNMELGSVCIYYESLKHKVSVEIWDGRIAYYVQRQSDCEIIEELRTCPLTEGLPKLFTALKFLYDGKYS